VAGIAVGVDVGGTKLAAGLVSADGNVLDRVRHTTPDTADKIADLIVDLATDFSTRHHSGAIPVGVGAAGLIDREGTVRFSPNLPWVDYPLGARLRDRLDGPVTVDNDANAAAWGEYRIGAGQDAHDSLVMLTIGTGVGGGLVLSDRVVRGAGGMGGELGHMTVLEGGPPCPCGATGCLESLASGSTIARLARERLAAGDTRGSTPLTAIDPAELIGKDVTVAAYAGDPLSLDILATVGRWLGVGIASLIAALDPEIVVVGGGAMQAGELILGPARDEVAARVVGRGHRDLPPIVAAALGDDAGLIGAALLAVAAAPGNSGGR
jgi:glucokinase